VRSRGHTVAKPPKEPGEKVLEGRDTEAAPFTVDAVARLLTDEVSEKMGFERVKAE
jgi:hypothetical protein